MDNQQAFSGIAKLYKNYDLSLITKKEICLIGIGGVGSWCAEALVRSGFKKLTLIDLDDICLSNTNRQIHTNLQTLGRPKVEAMKSRLKEIADDIEITVFHDFITAKNVDNFGLKKMDLVIDAFDSLSSKVALANYCLENNIQQIICGAAGGKSETTTIDFAPLNETENDLLLKKLKKQLRTRHYKDENQIKNITAVFSRQKAFRAELNQAQELKKNCQGNLGSSVMFTATMGMTAAQVAFEKVLD